MRTEVKDRIIMQGFSVEDVTTNIHINWLARWTPLACATLGSIGVLINGHYYLITLGVLTYIGAISHCSFYDYVYNYGFRWIWGTGEIPQHGNQRMFGCAIGGTLYVISGIGFLIKNPYIAYIPAMIIISLAFLAGITQWCFASQLYNLLFKRTEKCCE